MDKFDHPGLPPALILNLVNCKFCLSSRSWIICLLQLHRINFIMILITLRSPCNLWTKAIAIAFLIISPHLTSVLSDTVIFNLVKSKCTNTASVAREVIYKVILLTLVTFLWLVNSISNIRHIWIKPSRKHVSYISTLMSNSQCWFAPSWCSKVFTFTSPCSCPCNGLGRMGFHLSCLHVVCIDILNL